jgi:N,N-dimethylformamidase
VVLKLLGYSDRIYGRPGDNIRFMVSCEAMTYDAEIVRIICGDDNPAGPGIKQEVFASSIAGVYQGRRQNIAAGSYVSVPINQKLVNLISFTVQVFIWPTTPGQGRQALVGNWDGASASGFALIIDEQGGIALQIGDGKGGISVVATACRMLARRWYRVGAAYDAQTGMLRVFQHPLQPVPGIADGGVVERRIEGASAGNAAPLTMAPLTMAAMRERHGLTGFYNGKLDSPRLAKAALSEPECAAISGDIPPELLSVMLGAWDFSEGMGSQIAIDRSPLQLHGDVVNFPARAMTGWNWSGQTMNFADAPQEWGAIHFHDDDIYDAGWQADFELAIPPEMPSGLYAARLWSGADEEYIPFIVGPAPGAERAVAFLMPTASYMAYGNDRLAMDGGGAELLNNIVNIIGPQDIFLNEHPEFGGSLYDLHSDGSGICHSSRLRPLLNMRPKRQGLLGGFGGSKLWQFAADTHVIDWLEQTGEPYDIICDEELHDKGQALLAPYQAVITGTHPEYTSTAMLDAITAYRDGGGRIMYLGGNGFYWRIAYHAQAPGIIELRRGESGVRAWSAAPGETYQAFDGRQGGLWMRLGRSPQSVVGVGFSAQGFDVSGHYERLPDSYRQDAAFIFDGVGDEKIGDFGLIGGGAAGLEVDRAAAELGTPPNALVLAQSRNLTDTYLIVPEEFLETAPGLGADENALARADMVFFTVTGGGAVFSTGSIAWAGSLSHNGYQNNVARITHNVLRRFIDSATFPD